VPTQPKAVVASAVNISKAGAGAYKARLSGSRWQKDSWYHWDICGEYRYATTWIANAVSLANMYAAEVDPDTGLVTDATDNDVVNSIARTILGGPALRSQLQQTMALNWQVAGEFFILVRPSGSGLPDEWLVLSSSEVHEQSGSFSYEDPVTGMKTELVTNRDMLIRVWSPHPHKRSHADASARAALPILREIEKTSQNIASRLDSRLAGNGLLFLPNEVDFPQRGTGQPGLVDFMDEVIESARHSLDNPGEASAQVPIMLQVPGEQVGNIQHIDLSTDLDKAILELRTEAVRRLALTLDMPAEIMLGMGASNHWSAWQIEESAYKVHIAPLLDRLSDAITSTYFRPALLAAGVVDPERYILAFNTTEIISRPNRFQELMDLHEKQLISDDFVRSENGIPDDAKPTDEERQTQLFVEIIKAAPTILADFPQIAVAIGLDPVAAAQEIGTGPIDAAPPELEAPPTRALPQRAGDDANGSVQAAVGVVPLNHLTSAAELIVFDALSRAGGRLLTRSYRGQFSGTVKHELHTVIPFEPGRANCERLLEGSFQFADRVAASFGVDHTRFMYTIMTYVEGLLANRQPHDSARLREHLWDLIR
jgi:hypothetical protein